jgi:hypothetical protein
MPPVRASSVTPAAKPAPAPKVEKAKAAPTPAAAEPKEETPKNSRRGTLPTFALDQKSYEAVYDRVKASLGDVADGIIRGLPGKVDKHCLVAKATPTGVDYEYLVNAHLRKTMTSNKKDSANKASCFEEAADGGFIKHFRDHLFMVESDAQKRIRHVLVAAALLGKQVFACPETCPVTFDESRPALVDALVEAVKAKLDDNNLHVGYIEPQFRHNKLTLSMLELRATGPVIQTHGGAVSASAPVSGGSNTVTAKKAPKPSYLKAAVASGGGAGSETSFSQEEVAELKKAIKDAMKAKDFALVASLGAALTAMTQ